MNRTLMIVAPAAYPLGGVAQWLDYLLPGLQAKGWICKLALTQGRFHDVAAYLERHPWPAVATLSNLTGSPQGRIDSLARTITRIAPDIILGVNIACVYEAVRTLRLHGKIAPRLAVAVHGLQGDMFNDLRGSRDVVDAAIAVNQLACRLAAMHLGDPARVFYAPGGARINGSPARHTAVRHEAVRLMFCGRIEQEQKRVLDLAELALALQARAIPFSMSIVGGGADEQRLREKLRVAGVEHHFKFLGVCDQATLTREYAQHDALVITSTWETGPLTAWEAMGHSLPVISSMYVGSGQEAALEHGENCLLFPVGDMAAAVKAIEALRAPGLAAKLRLGGQKLVRERYTQAISVDAWSAALEHVGELPPLPTPAAVFVRRVNAGRLDKWLGAVAAERVRRLLGIRHAHHGPGGEWPHTTFPQAHSTEFFASAAQMDHTTRRVAALENVS